MIKNKDKEISKKLAEYLLLKYDEWASKQRGISNRTLTKWASYLGVPVGTLSHYMNQTRAPRGQVIYQLAASLGPEILELTGLPPALPDDPNVLELILLWQSPDVTDTQRQKALDALSNENGNGNGNGNNKK